MWIALLLYGGGVIDDLPLLERPGVRRIFGWTRVPDPTTFGRWLRRASERMVPLLDELLWRMVRQRWALLARGVPKKLTLTLDSTVVVRYGHTQAGAELGYNPKKRGRRSHHPLVAFINETGDCLGVRWRAGNAHTAAGAVEWLQALVGHLRDAGVGDITVRLDEGFFSQRMAQTLEELGVSFLLKVPRHGWLSGCRGPWCHSKKGEAIFPGEELWSATGSLWGARLLTIQTRKPVETEEGRLELDTYDVVRQADVLTNIPAVHALTAWAATTTVPWWSSGSRSSPSSRPARPPSTTSGAVPSCGVLPSWPTDPAYATPTLALGLLADGPAEAAAPLVAPVSREAGHPWAQELPAVASRRPHPPPPPRCLARTESRHPAPGACLSPAAASHVMGVARAPATLAPYLQRPLGPPVFGLYPSHFSAAATLTARYLLLPPPPATHWRPIPPKTSSHCRIRVELVPRRYT